MWWSLMSLETAAGDTRALQPRELYKSQQFATGVYRSELALGVKDLGYDVERGQSGQPEIRGYTAEYLEASSQRRQQIQDHLEKTQLHGPDNAHRRSPRTTSRASRSST